MTTITTPRRKLFERKSPKPSRPLTAERKRAIHLKPVIEGLEDRVVLSTWVGPATGGDYDTGTNWSTGVVPGSGDDVTITLASAGTITHNANISDSVHSLTTNSNAALSIGGGSLTLGNGNSSIGHSVEVKTGASLTVVDNASVYMPTSQTISVDSGASMSIGTASFEIANNNAGPYGLSVYGTLTTTGTTFWTQYGIGAYSAGSQVTIGSGGHLFATNTNFSWDSVSFGNGSVLNAGDVTGNTFAGTVFAPGTDIPYLAGTDLQANKQFNDVDIIAGSLNSGSLLLGSMGSGSTAKLRYVFPSGYEVKSGASLSIADNVNVYMPTSQTISVDSGASMSMGSDSFGIANNNAGPYGLSVYGTLTTTGTTFWTQYGIGAYSAGSQVTIGSGGHLFATNTNFSWDSVSFGNGSVLNAGDVTGNTFAGTVFAPGTDIPYLAGTDLQANKSFNDVDIIAGSLNSGSLLLGSMGSGSTAKLRYVFPSGYEVKSGASLSIADNVNVYMPTSQTISVDSGASMSMGSDSFGIANNNAGPYGLSVYGTLTTTGTTFWTQYGIGAYSAGSQVTIGSGGHLFATNTNFSWDSVSFGNGSVLNAGDVTGNTFAGTVFAPGTDIPYLAGTDLQANKSFNDVDIIAGSLNSGSLLLGSMGSGSTAKLRYVFPSGYEVKSGASLSIADNVNVYMPTSQTISVDSGASMSMGSDSFGIANNNAGPYGLSVYGTLTTTGTTFWTQYGIGAYSAGSQVTIGSGGHLFATNTNFSWDSVSFGNGSVLNAGDVTGNTFAGTVFAPGTDIPYLAGTDLQANKSFNDVDIIAGSLNSGSLLLGSMGSGSTAKLRYVFPSGYEVKSGASLSIADNVNVYMPTSQTISVDSGASMSMGSDSFGIANNNAGPYGLSVYGTLTTTGTTFWTQYGIGAYSAGSQVTIGSGGHLFATNTNFSWDSVSFGNGSVLNAGDVTGNTFAGTVFAPGTDIPYLAGTDLQANKSFNDVDIIAGSLNSGSLLLGSMGSGSTAKLRYVFPSGYEVKSGASLSIADNVNVYMPTSQTISVDSGASMSMGSDSFGIANNNAGPYGLSVYGTLTTTGTTFWTQYGIGAYSAGSQVTIGSGGHLFATNTNFSWDSVSFGNGSVLNAGDVTGNTFAGTVFAPGTDIPYLAGTDLQANKQFNDVDIIAGSLNSGSLLLGSMGSGSTAKLRYVFPSGYEVKSGASLSIADNVRVLIATSQSLIIDPGASMTIGAASVVSANNAGGPYGLSVSGTLTTTGTSFTTQYGIGAYSAGSQITVNATGDLVSTRTTFGWDRMSLNAGSQDTMASDVLAGTVTINSGATINIHGNDFSNIGAHGIVAVGDPSAIIDLTSNLWGTANTTQIQAKILDHYADATRPTVNFGSALSSLPSSITGVVYNDVNGNGVQDSGEVGLGGVVVYIDQNNSGTYVSSDPSTITDTTGHFAFGGIAAGTYVVRELPTTGTQETGPSASAVSTTVDFDSNTAGTGTVTAGAATFTGGTVFVPPSGDTALLYSGTQAYNTSSNPSEVDFSLPVSSATFFYTHGFGFASGVATAYDALGNILGTVNSKAATTVGDPANLVTLSFSKPIARITFLGGIVDHFTFITAANNQANVVNLQAGQTSNISFGNQYINGTLSITNFTPTPTGFTVTFGTPLNQSVLNLYDSGGQYGASDVTLVGTKGTIHGSMVISADGKTATFIQTGGILPNDTYTVTLVSGANAFENTNGGLLDGNGDSIPGDNFVSTFTINNPSNAVVVGIPDFTRGYGQTVNVPASTNTGLPVNISTGLNVSSVQFTLTYDPTLLTLADGVFNTSIVGASAVFHVVTPGTAVLTVSSATQFSTTSGALTLGYLSAVVPNNAPYATKEILHISNLLVFDNSPNNPQPLPAVNDDAIHVAAYFGDTNGDQRYTTQDVTLEQRDIALVNSGFAPYRMADPVLVGDINSNGAIQSNDSTNIQRVIALQSVPNIPALPTGLPTVPTGPDPEIYIGNVQGNPGTTVNVPVYLNVTEPAGISISSFQIVVSFDPSKFTVNAATIDSAFSDLGNLSVYTPNGLPGTIVILSNSVNGTGTIPFGTNAVLFTMSFQIAAGAATGTTPINLLNDASNANGDVQTLMFANDANQTQLVLSPAPTNASNDVVDGVFGISTKVLTSIAVTPLNATAPKGTTPQFDAVGTYSDGSTADLTNQVTWASANTSVATISNTSGTNGLCTALATGTTVITATLGNVTSPDDTLTVSPAAVASISVSPSSPSATNGSTVQFHATGTYTDNTTADLTSQVTWASANTSVATISNSSGTQGLASTLAVGTSVITATLNGIQSPGDLLTVTPAALLSISVVPVDPSEAKGKSLQFTAVGTYSDNSTADITSQVTWASATPTVASISNSAGSQGLALATGTSVITATLNGVTSPDDTLTVTAATLSSIAVYPSNPSAPKGTTEQFTAIGTYSDNSTADITNQVTWASATPAVATISNTSGTLGLASALSQGTTVITATLNGVQSPNDVLTVTAAVLSSINVTPSNPSTPKGTTEQFTATGVYTDKSTADLTSSVTWASGTTTVAAIDQTGLANALNTGTSIITATLNGVTGSSVLNVTPAALQAIAIVPSNPSTPKGATEQFTAKGTYTDNSTADLTSLVTWASATPAVATIDQAGLATTLTIGTSSISATLNGISGTTVLTVTAAALKSITISPSDPVIAKGTTEPFTATGVYTDNTTSDLTNSAVWASGTLSVAIITQAGVATGVSKGTSVITASFNGISGTTLLSVTDATLQSISVTPTNPSIAKGLTEQFTATGTYSDNTTADLTSSVTWASGTPSTATITSGGLATGLALGTTTITATSGSISGSTVLTVSAATLTSISVTPTNPSIAKGLTEQFTATGTYSDNTTADLTSSVTWASGTPSTATITSGGLATGLALGTTTITATSGSISGSTVLTVSAATLTSISVTPTNPSIAKGLTEQFKATGTYSDNTTADLTSSVTWASGTPSTATITSGGLATGLALGTTTITATSGSISGSTVLTVSAATLTSISVTPTNPSIAKGLTEQFTATGTYSDNTTADLTSSVTWASGTPSTATITSGGLATGLALGTTTITATSGSISGSTVLTVSAATLTSISVTPTNPSIAKGLTEQFTATGTYSDNTTADLTSSVTWASGTPSTATITSGGLATGLALGTTTITATSGSISGSTVLTVSAATLTSISVTPTTPSIAKGLTEQFTATGTYSDNTTADLTSSVTWASGTPSTATITSGGLATGLALGTTTITATSGSISGSTVLTVSAATLTSISVTPTNPSIAKGLTEQFTATGTYSDNTTADLTSSVTWASGTPSTATITSGGLATGLALGTTTITATSGSISGSTVLTVSAATLTSISVTPTTPSIAKGLTEQFTATGTYSDNTTADLTSSVTWASGTPSTATITSGGLATGLALGTTTITATSGSISGSTVLTVSAATLTSISVTPTTPSIAKGLTEQFTATGTYSDNTTADLTSSVTWASGTPSTATITSGGLATGLALGTTTITATSGSISGSTVLTVSAATLTSISVTPTNPSIAKGSTEQFTATGTYSDNTTADLTSSVTWASGTPSTATITSGGLATGLALGTTTITATSGSISGSTVLTVSAATLQSISVTPVGQTIPKGATLPCTATGTYSDGSTLDLTNLVTWVSSDISILIINGSGVAQGVGIGSASITASLGGVTSGADGITVSAPALVSIDVTPSNGSLPKGLTAPCTATGTYTDGTTADLTNLVTWVSSNTSVAIISNSPGTQGFATGVSLGTTTITASLGGVTSPGDTLTVTPAILASIDVSPANPSIPKGTTQAFQAIGTYSDGTTADLTGSVAWASATPTVATITPAGLATGLGLGTTGITATLGGIGSPADVLTVTPAALLSLAVTPLNPSIAQGATIPFQATGTYTDGTTADLTPTVTWATTNPNVATISPTGVATGVSPGTTGITATENGVTSPSDPLTVTPAVATVSVTGVSVRWGSQTAALQTASDGVRLLPAGRSTDLPWFNVNRLVITLDQAAAVSPGDVTVTGSVGGGYGPVTVAGSGTTTLVITLARPFNVADRVTLTIGNSDVITYTRRLDVLPGDVNDDGVVNTSDGVVILNNPTPAHAYQIFDDMNGDLAVNTSDFTLYRPKIGTFLPGLPAQLAAGGEGPGHVARLTSAEVAPVLADAVHIWAAAGLPASDIALLKNVKVQIEDLPAGYLGGTAIGGTTITLSADASGYGWNVDQKASAPGAATHEDLLTVVLHELGHTLGLEDLDPSTFPNDLMATTLATGVRRLPSALDLATVVINDRTTMQASPIVLHANEPVHDAVIAINPPATPSAGSHVKSSYKAIQNPNGSRAIKSHAAVVQQSGNTADSLRRDQVVVLGRTHPGKVRV